MRGYYMGSSQFAIRKLAIHNGPNRQLLTLGARDQTSPLQRLCQRAHIGRCNDPLYTESLGLLPATGLVRNRPDLSGQANFAPRG